MPDEPDKLDFRWENFDLAGLPPEVMAMGGRKVPIPNSPSEVGLRIVLQPRLFSGAHLLASRLSSRNITRPSTGHISTNNDPSAHLLVSNTIQTAIYWMETHTRPSTGYLSLY